MRGGPPGDLYIFLSLSAHQFFQRDGADLHCRVPISMVTAALGGEFEVPTIDKGKTKVKIPAGTQSGRRFRIASKGMPVLRSRQMGDMYVQVVVETPQNLTRKQQELLAEFEKLSSGATQPEAAGFFTKVKDFFGSRAGSLACRSDRAAAKSLRAHDLTGKLPISSKMSASAVWLDRSSLPIRLCDCFLTSTA